MKNKIILIIICILLTFNTIASAITNQNKENILTEHIHFNDILNKDTIWEHYVVPTIDGYSITLIRYVGIKRPSIMLIHGMGGNHKMFDYDENHSLARYLSNQGWDIWLLDLRTHDGDGDFLFEKNSDREYIDRYWDFDNHLLKIDVATAVDFIKIKADYEKIILGGHSYGGYLAYAYSMMLGEENLSGIITTGACPYENPKEFQHSRIKMLKYGFFVGNKAYVNPFGRKAIYGPSKILMDYYISKWDKFDHSAIFYKNTTPLYIQQNIGYYSDGEASGVYVDMFFGKDPIKYNGHWVDPQTLYDYSENLHKITVPILFIAGDEDTQDPKEGIYKAYQNVSSKNKTFLHYPNHSHLDLLLGDNAENLIFSEINNWLSSLILNIDEN